MVVILCIVSSNVLYKLGVPTLLIFLALGMLCGSDAIGGIYFDNYEIAKNVCSVGLVFIMFFGGFGTSWKTAKSRYCAVYFNVNGGYLNHLQVW